MVQVTTHRHFHNGVPRPHWAGTVQSVSRQRITAPNQLTESTELTGLVLPVHSPSSPSGSQAHTHGRSLGFPDLGEQFGDASPDLWSNWGRLEQLLGEAAAATMGWDGHQEPRRASGMTPPANALHVRVYRQTLKSTAPEDEGGLLRPDSISGDISKVFAIRDVSGSQLRYESAGTSAAFHVTSSSVHWSRDPRTL